MNKIEAIQKHLDEWNIDCLLVTTGENIRYLTNFTGSSGAVLISKSEAIFLTDFRYKKQSYEQISGYDIIITNESSSLFGSVIDQVNSMNVNSLGFESSYLSHEAFINLQKGVNIDLTPTKKIVEQLREVKSREEIELIKKASAISDKAFEQILNFIRPGITERDVANQLEFEMRKEGAESSAFDMIVASGHRAALPHGLASNKVIEKGDMVKLDFGALYEGYCSDITRTVSIGKPNAKFKDIYNIVLESLLTCEQQMKSGMSAKQVDAIVRDYITDKGYGDYFGHGAGHGIGLMVHEDPFFSKSSQHALQKGMVVTIEPGIYLPNFGGVRIEDNVEVTDKGIEVITKAPKELIVL